MYGAGDTRAQVVFYARACDTRAHVVLMRVHVI